MNTGHKKILHKREALANKQMRSRNSRSPSKRKLSPRAKMKSDSVQNGEDGRSAKSCPLEMDLAILVQQKCAGSIRQDFHI
jgi:hypothetical protein